MKIFTLGANKNDGNLLNIPVLSHLGVVVVDGVEGGLVLQAEHEDDGINPGSELKYYSVKYLNGF